MKRHEPDTHAVYPTREDRHSPIVLVVFGFLFMAGLAAGLALGYLIWG